MKSYMDILIKSVENQSALNQLMHDLILIDYETGNPKCITDIRGAESGEDNLVIETECSDGTMWRHTIKTEEI